MGMTLGSDPENWYQILPVSDKGQLPSGSDGISARVKGDARRDHWW
jgi:hypothetical protein